MKTKVTIVYDTGKNKLRATCKGGWVRFPNALRVEGAVFECQVKEGASGSFIALEPISPVNAQAKRAMAEVA